MPNLQVVSFKINHTVHSSRYKFLAYSTLQTLLLDDMSEEADKSGDAHTQPLTTCLSIPSKWFK